MSSGVSRRRQATRAGWLGAQGVGGAGTSFAEMVEALQRQHGLAGVEQWRREKQRRRNEKNGDGTSFKGWPGSKQKPRRGLLHASAKPRAATGATGSQKKVAGGVV